MFGFRFMIGTSRAVRRVHGKFIKFRRFTVMGRVHVEQPIGVALLRESVNSNSHLRMGSVNRKGCEDAKCLIILAPP
jgi:hypothetical protein